jgi:hypothetical protein
MFALKVVYTPASENEVRFIYPVAFLNFRILEFWGFQGFWKASLGFRRPRVLRFLDPFC